MALNNLRVIYANKAVAVTNVGSSISALSDYKSDSTATTSSSISVMLSASIATGTKFGVAILLASSNTNITMSISGTGVTNASSTDTSAVAVTQTGYGSGKYVSCWSVATSNVSSVTITIPLGTVISKIIIGEYWSPTYNTSFGMQVGYADSSSTTRTQSGDLYTTNSPRNKALSFDLSYLSESDKYTFFNILKQCGKVTPIYVNLFPESSDKDKEQMYQIFGKFTDLTTITHSMYTIYGSSVSIEEI